MNKYQEALKKMCDDCEYSPIIGKCSFKCPIKDELKELVEKATPKKPLKSVGRWDFIYYNCPICGEYLGWSCDSKAKYCDDCGQALDWEIEVQEDECY